MCNMGNMGSSVTCFSPLLSSHGSQVRPSPRPSPSPSPSLSPRLHEQASKHTRVRGYSRFFSSFFFQFSGIFEKSVRERPQLPRRARERLANGFSFFSLFSFFFKMSIVAVDQSHDRSIKQNKAHPMNTFEGQRASHI